MENLAREVASMNRYGYSSAILMLDIDEFKAINDQFGHIAGDTILVKIVNIIQDSLRGSDFMGRWGGDEFIACLTRVDRENALLIANRIHDEVEKSIFKVADEEIHRTVSIGIAFLDPLIDNEDDIICKADDALVNGKKLGKNRIEVAE